MDVTIQNYEDQVTQLAERYCAAAGISLGTLGNKAVKDFEFFTRIKEKRGGRNINTVRAALLWLEKNMPKKPKK